MKFYQFAFFLLVPTTFAKASKDNGHDGNDNERILQVPFQSSQQQPEVEDIFQLGTPTWGGSGCPEGTVQIITSPEDIDGEEGTSAVTVLFDAYEADTGLEGLSRVYKSCNLAIPLKAKAGLQLGIFRIMYRGNAYVPPGRGYMAQFSAEYFFSGLYGPRVRRSFGRFGEGYGYDLGDFGDFDITNDIEAVVWSPCGVSTNLRINTSIVARRPRDGMEDTSIIVNSVDATVEHTYTFRYYLAYRYCPEEETSFP